MSVERGSNNKPVKIEHEAGGSYHPVVERIAHKTRTGFIPQMRKVNQDAYFYQKDLAGMQNLWMIGVMDGHGVNGHQVSAFVK
jgi:serine/threonine protein phosphatase PrpC